MVSVWIMKLLEQFEAVARQRRLAGTPSKPIAAGFSNFSASAPLPAGSGPGPRNWALSENSGRALCVFQPRGLRCSFSQYVLIDWTDCLDLAGVEIHCVLRQAFSDRVLGVASLREAGVLQDFAALRSRVRDNAAHFLALPDASVVWGASLLVVQGEFWVDELSSSLGGKSISLGVSPAARGPECYRTSLRCGPRVRDNAAHFLSLPDAGLAGVAA